MVLAAREVFSSISPAWSGWIAPGRIGFMSTQRMEIRSTPAIFRFRRVSRDISNPEADHGFRKTRFASRPEGRPECDGMTQTPVAQAEVAQAIGISAPPVELVPFHRLPENVLEAPAATSLQSDNVYTPFAGIVPPGTCRSLSPQLARRCAASTQHLHSASFPNRSALPVLRVSIRHCRGYRQH